MQCPPASSKKGRRESAPSLGVGCQCPVPVDVISANEQQRCFVLENWTPRAQTGAWSTGMSHDPEQLCQNMMFFMLSSKLLCFIFVGTKCLQCGGWVDLASPNSAYREVTPLPWGDTACSRCSWARWSQSPVGLRMCQVLFCLAGVIGPGVEEPCGPGLALLSHLKLLKHSKAAPAAPQGSAKGANSDSGFEWQSEWLIQLQGQAQTPQQSIGIRIPPVADLKLFLINKST